MTSELLSRLLESGRGHLEALRQGDDGYERGTLEGLMSIAYTMGKLLIGAPEMRSESAVRHFLDETVSVLNVRYVDLDYYSWTIARRFQETWESNEWEQLCIARSGLQFFTDLLRETVPAEELTATHFGDLDDFIRERGDDDSYLPEEEIPPEIPLSHWWWWYPKAPHRR